VAATTLAGCWHDPWGNADRSRYDPSANAITAANVGSLALEWTSHVDSGSAHDAVQTNSGLAVNDDANAYGIGLDGSRLWKREASFTQPVFSDGGTVLVPSLASSTDEGGTTTWVTAADGTPTGRVESGRLLARRGDIAVLGASFSPHIAPGLELQVLQVWNLATDQLVWGGWPGGTGARALPDVTVGRKWIYHAGDGTIADAPGMPVVGNALRAWDLVDPVDITQFGGPYIAPTWAVPLDGSTAVPPVLDPSESVVYTGTDAGTVYAVDIDSHAVLWTASVGSAVTASPALANGRLYVPTASGTLTVLDAGGCGAATCSPLWTASATANMTVQPAVAGGLVYTGASNGAVRAFAADGCGASTCAPLWSTGVLSPITGGPTVFAGRVFYGTASGYVVSYKPTS
jgi:outer membrane protein assembly factor BamB